MWTEQRWILMSLSKSTNERSFATLSDFAAEPSWPKKSRKRLSFASWRTRLFLRFKPKLNEWLGPLSKVYGNIGVLDLRHTQPDAFANESYSFGNIGTVLYSTETTPLLKNIKAGNIGNFVECETDVHFIQGKMVLGSEALGDLKSPLNLHVMGKLVVLDDVSPSSKAISQPNFC
jgi:hypothetical protein